MMHQPSARCEICQNPDSNQMQKDNSEERNLNINLKKKVNKIM